MPVGLKETQLPGGQTGYTDASGVTYIASPTGYKPVNQPIQQPVQTRDTPLPQPTPLVSLPPPTSTTQETQTAIKREPTLVSTDQFRRTAEENLSKIYEQANRIYENVKKQEQDRLAKEQAASEIPQQASPQDISKFELDSLGITSQTEGITNPYAQQEKDIETQYKDVQDKLDTMATTGDTETATRIANIKSMMAQRKEQMKDINMRSQQALEQMGIKTGGGRYSASFTGIMSAEERAGIDRITELDRQEQELISAAEEAGRSKKFDTLAAKMKMIESKRSELNEKIKTFNSTVVEKNKKLQEQAEKSKLSQSIASLFSSGVTDKTEMVQTLAKKGFNVDIKQISEAMNELIPDTKEIDGVMKELAKIPNLPPSVMKQVSGATSMSEALDAAGDWLQEGSTPEQKEYIYARNLARSKGLPEPSYEEIVARMDAKKKKETATLGGLDTKTQTVVSGLSTQFSNSPIVKSFNEVLNKKLGVDNIINNGVGGPADLALVFDFMKALDPNSVVREAEYDNAAKSGNIFKGWAAKFNGYMKEGGGFLPNNVKKEFQNITNLKYKSIEKQYENLQNQFAQQINRRTGRSDGADFLIDYKVSTGQVGDEIINEQEADKQEVFQMISGDGKKRNQYKDILKNNPGISFSDIKNIFR